VRFDPDCSLLAKINFTTPASMLSEQLSDTNDVPGRLMALNQISKKQDKESMARFKRMLNTDPYYAVREEAARILRSIRTDEAFDILLASTNQTDARVRLAVTRAITGFYREEAYQFAVARIGNEKNPEIQSVCIESLGAYNKPEVTQTLIGLLDSDSHNNTLASGAVEAMRGQDDAAFIEPLLASLPRQETNYTNRRFANALSALAFLARNEENKNAVREFILPYINSKKRTIQNGAITALGTLGDSKAIAPLETIAESPKESREKATATRVIAELRGTGKRADEFKGFRTEVLDLQKSSKELRKELDDLKKKVAEKNSATRTATQSQEKPRKKTATPVTSPRAQ
jgi:aminopeptidase N